MNAMGVRFGFLILRTCDTSLVKGPRTILQLSVQNNWGIEPRTVEAELLRIDFDGHICEICRGCKV